MNPRFTFAALGCALALAPAAIAQDAIMALNPTVMVSTAGQISATEQLRRQFGSNLRSRRAAPPRAVTPARLAFRPDPKVRNRIYARAVEQMRRIDAASAAKLQKEFDSGLLQRASVSYLGRYGLSPNNLADTTALYLASAWLATRGDAGDPSKGQMLGLRRQIAAAFLANPTFATQSDEIKQEISETNLIQAGYVASLANAAAANPSVRPQVRDSVSRGVMAMYAMDLRQLNLTDQGLR